MPVTGVKRTGNRAHKTCVAVAPTRHTPSAPSWSCMPTICECVMLSPHSTIWFRAFFFSLLALLHTAIPAARHWRITPGRFCFEIYFLSGQTVHAQPLMGGRPCAAPAPLDTPNRPYIMQVRYRVMAHVRLCVFTILGSATKTKQLAQQTFLSFQQSLLYRRIVLYFLVQWIQLQHWWLKVNLFPFHNERATIIGKRGPLKYRSCKNTTVAQAISQYRKMTLSPNQLSQ